MATQSQSKSPGTARWYYISLPLLLVWSVNNADKANIGILLADHAFVKDLGISTAVFAGIVASAFSWIYGLSQFVWGYLTKRFGARASTALGAVIWAISMLIGAASASMGSMIFSRMLLGFGEGNSYPTSLTLTARWFPRRERARAQSIWYNGINVGPALILPIVTFIILRWGWRPSFVALAVLSLIIAIVVWVCMRNSPAEHHACSEEERAYIEQYRATDDRTSSNKTVSQAMGDVNFWLVTIAYLFQAAAYWSVVIFLPSFLEKSKHITFAHSALIASGAFVLAFVFQLLFGFWSDRSMRRAPFAIAGWIAVMVMMAISMVSGPLVASIMQMLIVAVLNVTGLMLLTLMQQTVASDAMSLSSGVFGGISNFVSSFGPLAVGFVAAVGGFGLGISAVLATLVVPIVCIAVWLVRNRHVEGRVETPAPASV